MPFPNKATQFQPGNNANPKGRPLKKDCVSDCLRVLLEGKDLRGRVMPDGKTVAQHLAEEILIMAMGGRAVPAGKVPLVDLILERVEGKVSLPIDASVTGRARVVIVESNGRATREPLGNGNGHLAIPGPGGSSAEIREDIG